MKNIGQKAFTLIELLIVVAIIAILAAIAVPNFLEAQTRAKVSRVKADMRSAATGLESYAIDWNTYPYDGYNYDGTGWGAGAFNYWYLSKLLTTPQAYLTTCIFIDPFRQEQSSLTHWQLNNLRYTNIESTWGIKWDQIQSGADAVSIYYPHLTAEYGGWRINGAGPDRTYGPPNSGSTASWPGKAEAMGYPVGNIPLPYDPTNGTVSPGDILRSQASPTGYTNVGG